jgi:hypothetical protein
MIRPAADQAAVFLAVPASAASAAGLQQENTVSQVLKRSPAAAAAAVVPRLIASASIASSAEAIASVSAAEHAQEHRVNLVWHDRKRRFRYPARHPIGAGEGPVAEVAGSAYAVSTPGALGMHMHARDPSRRSDVISLAGLSGKRRDLVCR